MTVQKDTVMRVRKAVRIGPPLIVDSFLFPNSPKWRLDLGANVTEEGTTFRVWAPERNNVAVELSNHETFVLSKHESGYFTGQFPEIKKNALYKFQLDDGARFPDPCSRYQPQGPHGPSQIIDPQEFPWTDHNWKGIQMAGQVIYELHVGTFTEEGTLDAAARELDRLKDIGVTVIELMPLNECAGRWNWGYDGVDLFAPYHVYGPPDALKRFVDSAHALRMAVVLDVVYNHFGPDGNYLTQFSDNYFSKQDTEWGEAINFDGPNCEAVRHFFIQNACYWISEFHLDGLRLDATQSIFDNSRRHILAEISANARAAAGDRAIILIAENEPQNVRCVQSIDEGGFGLDAMWNDDFHHASRVAITGFSEAYFTDYTGNASEFVALAKHGFLFQGQYYGWQKKNRGTPTLHVPKCSFVTYTQNHDQVANHPDGKRLHEITDQQTYRALLGFALLAPGTPMLFMGQEFESPRPFHFFTDHNKELAKAVDAGRREFLSQFPTYRDSPALAAMLNPNDEVVFSQSKIGSPRTERALSASAFVKELLSLRRTDPVLAQSEPHIDGAVLHSKSFALRYFDATHGDRLMIVNLGSAFDFSPVSEPLLAPPENSDWNLLWTSAFDQAPRPKIDTSQGVRIPRSQTCILNLVPRSLS